MAKYTTAFKIVGPAYDESLILLRELHRRGRWEEVREATYTENLLKKRTRGWIGKLVEHTRRRYIDEHSPLPNGRDLTRFAFVDTSKQAKTQVLYQYICEAYPFVDRLVCALVSPNVLDYGAFRLTKETYRDFLQQEAARHPEITRWANYTNRRFERAFYTFLRDTGLMENHPSVLVRKFVLRPEAFAFFLFGLIGEGFGSSEILDSHIWERYFLTRSEIEKILSECQVRGWLQYRSLGSIVELTSRFGSVGEWIDALE